MTEPGSWKFYRRMPVYLAGGRPLGHVIEVGHAVDVVHVQQGRVLVRDWYIPAGAIDRVTAGGVYLRVGPSELRRNRWNVPPAHFLARQGATPGYEYTSPADIPSYGDTDVASSEV